MYFLLRLCVYGLMLLTPTLLHAQGNLENPRNGSFYSGIGVVSGWKCTANGPLTVRFNGGPPLPLAYGNSREDTRSRCGDSLNGFVSIYNYGILDSGRHTAVVYDNGEEFARSTFDVATTGVEFLTGASARFALPDFPSPGEITWFAWNEATQHLEMVDSCYDDDPPFVPTNLRISDTEPDWLREDWLTLVWDAPYPLAGDPAFKSYRIYQTRVASGEETEYIYRDDPPRYHVDLDNLIPREDYCFRVALEWGDCVTAASNEVCTRTADLDNCSTNSIGMEFVRIEPGTFQMGSPPDEEDREDTRGDRYGDETLHQVTISQPFCIGKYEVTQAQWNAVMESNRFSYPDCGTDCPAETVFWSDAQEFVRRLNALEGTTTYRLPMEAEWEYAARAGTQTPFHFGDDVSQLCDYANFGDATFWGSHPFYCADGVGRTTAPVGSYQPNAWGLYDMHGNVEEWVADWYGDYPVGPVTDPTGPATGTDRIRRGGSYFDHPSSCRAASRAYVSGGTSGRVGFRVARTIP